MTTAYLLASASVTLDGTGQGRTSMGPDRAQTWWKVTRLVTSTADGSSAELLVYRTFVSPATLLDSTRMGAGDTSETDFELRSGDSLVCVYSGGTPDAVGTVVAYGELQGVTR